MFIYQNQAASQNDLIYENSNISSENVKQSLVHTKENTQTKFVVDDYCNKDIFDIQSELDSKNISYTVQHEYSDTFGKNRIISQSVTKGSKIDSSDKIVFVVSLGKNPNIFDICNGYWIEYSPQTSENFTGYNFSKDGTFESVKYVFKEQSVKENINISNGRNKGTYVEYEDRIELEIDNNTLIWYKTSNNKILRHYIPAEFPGQKDGNLFIFNHSYLPSYKVATEDVKKQKDLQKQNIQ